VVGNVPQGVTGGQDVASAPRGDLAPFREEFYGCLTDRADELFELTEAVLCTDGRSRRWWSWRGARAPPRSRGALRRAQPRPDRGWVGCIALAGLPLPRAGDWRIVLGADVSPWLRPDAPTSPQR